MSTSQTTEVSENEPELLPYVKGMVHRLETGVGVLTEKLSMADLNVGRIHALHSRLYLEAKIPEVETHIKEVETVLEDLRAEFGVMLISRFNQHRFAIREMMKVNGGKKRKASTNVFQTAEAVEAEPDDALREKYSSIFQKIFGYPISHVLE